MHQIVIKAIEMNNMILSLGENYPDIKKVSPQLARLFLKAAELNKMLSTTEGSN